MILDLANDILAAVAHMLVHIVEDALRHSECRPRATPTPALASLVLGKEPKGALYREVYNMGKIITIQIMSLICIVMPSIITNAFDRAQQTQRGEHSLTSCGSVTVRAGYTIT